MTRLVVGLALCAVLAAAPATPAVGQERFTLEEVMSAPFPSGLVAAPEGDLVVWVRNDRGVRNVWVAEGPDFEARAVTSYDADDGQELGDLVVTRDRRVLFVRGGAPNRQGEIPNPESVAEGAERSLWIVSVDGGEPRKIEDGRSGELSPSGDRLAFVEDGRIRVVGLHEGSEAETLAELRGRSGSLAWSPDGTRLAFASARGDHGYVGVLDLESRAITWMDPGVDGDRSPAWSPDGRRLAFVRIPAQRDRLPFSPVREGIPWSIRVADPATGTSSEVFQAAPGPGSAFQSASGPSLMWGDDDRLVFPWERTGWLHLWSVPADGGSPVDLTPGEHEVQNVTLAPGGATILYDSNRGDIDRKHLWEVPVDGRSAPRLLTPGTGLEWAPVRTAEGTLAYLGSGPREAARAFVLLDGERRAPAGLLPASFPAGELVVPEQVVFPAADGMEIHGQLFVPADLEGGERRPAVLFFHGGSRRQMLLGFHHRGYYHNAYAFNQYLASKGYLVLSVNYRSGIGYGMEFREAIDYGAAGASEFADVLGAGLYMASRSDVDPDRIGLWGGSYGGYLTALGLARASDMFAAGVDVHGVHDWNVVIGNFVSSYDPGERADFARTAFQSSPMAYMDGWRSPVLLIHGDDDRNVPFSETVDLVRALRERGMEPEQLVFPDEVHGFLLHRSWLRAFRAAADFLDRELAGAGGAGTSAGGGR